MTECRQYTFSADETNGFTLQKLIQIEILNQSSEPMYPQNQNRGTTIEISRLISVKQ